MLAICTKDNDLENFSAALVSTVVLIFFFPSDARISRTHSGSFSTCSGEGRSPRLGRRFIIERFIVTHTEPDSLFRSYILVSSVRNWSFSRRTMSLVPYVRARWMMTVCCCP